MALSRIEEEEMRTLLCEWAAQARGRTWITSDGVEKINIWLSEGASNMVREVSHIVLRGYGLRSYVLTYLEQFEEFRTGDYEKRRAAWEAKRDAMLNAPQGYRKADQ